MNRAKLLTSVSLWALHIGAPRLTARQMADIMAGAYQALGLKHLDQVAA